MNQKAEAAAIGDDLAVLARRARAAELEALGHLIDMAVNEARAQSGERPADPHAE
jgi:hypothetical protein